MNSNRSKFIPRVALSALALVAGAKTLAAAGGEASR